MVKHLLVKRQHGQPLSHKANIAVGPKGGIKGNVPCPPLRQVLLVPLSTLVEFYLKPGDLRENLVVEGIDLHSLKSGTILTIGDVEVHLTFHCEPCKVISDKVDLRAITHKRGYLGRFITSGSISVGDSVFVQGQEFDPIPYDIKDRIKWYLQKRTEPVSATKLVLEVGLSQSYCRALPGMLKSRPDIDANMVFFKSRDRQDHRQLSLDFEDEGVEV